MQRTQRRTQSRLIDRLIAQPSRFSFFQAMRLIELWLRGGGSAQTLDSAMRFRNSVSLRFPPSEIETITIGTIAGGSPSAHVQKVHLTPAFMGFLGVNGVLPLDYTAMAAAQITFDKNEGGRAFFDNFSHRSMLLFYRAWAKCRIEYRSDAEDREGFLGMQLALAGQLKRPQPRAVAAVAVRNQVLPDEVIARYAALIRHRPVQVELMAGVLNDYFAVPVRCQTFVGAWRNLDGDSHISLGKQNHRLGRDTMLGSRYWRRDAIVRVRVGPLARADFESFLRGGSAAKALKAMLSLFPLPTVEFEIRPVLRAADVRPAALDARTRLGQAAILLATQTRQDHEYSVYRINFSTE